MRITNGAYIVDNLGKILIAHPTNHPEDMWSIPKGLSEVGESSKESAIRETKEETNLDLTHYDNITTYKFLGSENYSHKKKRLKAHLFYIDYPLSTIDMDLTCYSLFDCEKTGMQLPENDITKWETIEFAKQYLHYSQKNILKKVEDFLVGLNLK